MCVGVGVRASAHTLSGLWDSQGSPDHFSPLGVGVGRPGPSPDPSPFSLKGKGRVGIREIIRSGLWAKARTGGAGGRNNNFLFRI